MGIEGIHIEIIPKVLLQITAGESFFNASIWHFTHSSAHLSPSAGATNQVKVKIVRKSAERQNMFTCNERWGEAVLTKMSRFARKEKAPEGFGESINKIYVMFPLHYV